MGGDPVRRGRIGAVLVNVNPGYRHHELEDALRMADVATLMVGSAFKSSDFVGMVHAVCPEAAAARGPGWAAARLPALRRLVALGERPGPGWLTWSDLEAGAGCSLAELDHRERQVSLERRGESSVHLRDHRTAQGGDAHSSATC